MIGCLLMSVVLVLYPGWKTLSALFESGNAMAKWVTYWGFTALILFVQDFLGLAECNIWNLMRALFALWVYS